MYYSIKVRIRGFSIFDGSSRDVENLTFDLPGHVEIDMYVELVRSAMRLAIEDGYYTDVLQSSEIVLLSITVEKPEGDEEE